MIEKKHKYSLGKDEKLRHRSLVDGTFSGGKTLYDFPLRLTYRPVDNDRLESSFKNGVPSRIGSLQMLITVPKKKLRHAVDRVRMRRRIREAYRLNRLHLKELIEKNEKYRTLSMGFVYMHNDLTDYALIEKKMIRLLEKLQKELSTQD